MKVTLFPTTTTGTLPRSRPSLICEYIPETYSNESGQSKSKTKMYALASRIPYAEIENRNQLVSALSSRPELLSINIELSNEHSSINELSSICLDWILVYNVFSSNTSTLQICALEILQSRCIFEIPRKVVFFEIFLYWFKCTNYSLCDMIFFPKYNWKYHISSVLGTVIKCQKGTGSALEKNTTKSCVFYKQYICSV